MPRPAGMHKDKVTGIWYMKDGSVAPCSRDKVNQVTPQPVVIKDAPKQEVTVKVETVKRYGTRAYSYKEIKHIEATQEKTHGGYFADDCGILVPVFFNANRDQDYINGHMANMRMGI